MTRQEARVTTAEHVRFTDDGVIPVRFDITLNDSFSLGSIPVELIATARNLQQELVFAFGVTDIVLQNF